MLWKWLSGVLRSCCCFHLEAIAVLGTGNHRSNQFRCIQPVPARLLVLHQLEHQP